ncbi:c6 zinc finger domain containing protein [Niveomyces insectorum RCEF 264]|uniref:C6 zinc finger domain containing protein n=1 Tax=Niveomyces insectorum RCEF 264 TaxID=1081102 RepID=A0A162KB37_9HYPO|nr:c6 zinc finger domain containing protein [Niveomyces insectorum RCEF 264]
MPPRRSHKKSRAGCRRCKSRKIKVRRSSTRCTVVHIVTSFVRAATTARSTASCAISSSPPQRPGVLCDFESPAATSDYSASTPRSAYAASPTPAATPRMPSVTPATPRLPPNRIPGAAVAPLGPPPTPYLHEAPPPSSLLSTRPPSSSLSPPLGSTRLLELRLLHHFATSTCKTLCYTGPTAEHIWRDKVPRMAFAAAARDSPSGGSSHLTDAVLAVAALHLRSEFPHDRDLVRASHAYMASSLNEYNRLLQQGINAHNAEALFVNSTLIAFQSTAARIFNKDDASVSHKRSSSGSGNGNGSVGANGFSNGFVYDGVKGGFGGGGGGNGGDHRLPEANEHATFDDHGSSGYSLPMSWFHALQGVKAVTAAAWMWLRRSEVALPIVNSQPILQLEIASASAGFFGHLLEGLDEEVAALPRSNGHPPRAPSPVGVCLGSGGSSQQTPNGAGHDTRPPGDPAMPSAGAGPEANNGLAAGMAQDDQQRVPAGADEAAHVRHAYRHAVAVLNWAHALPPRNGACLAFPATVSRCFVDLLNDRASRALVILACFFAMLKTLDGVWWLRGTASREVLGVVSLFRSDAVPADVERRWWPHLQWALRVALYQDQHTPSDYVPPEVWNAPFQADASGGGDADADGDMDADADADADLPLSGPGTYGHHIDLITATLNHAQSLSGLGSTYSFANHA